MASESDNALYCIALRSGLILPFQSKATQKKVDPTEDFRRIFLSPKLKVN